MPLEKLTERRCKALTVPGVYGDGGGLYLRVNKPRGDLPPAKNWVFVWRRKDSGRHELGLGGYGQGTAPVSLALAREKAADIRERLARGEDPSKPKAKGELKSFKDCADIYLEMKRAELKSAKSFQGWELSLNEYAKPLHDLLVASITVDDVVSCVQPHWQVRPESAARLQARIANVMAYAIARGLRTKANPAQWHGLLDKVLPARKKLTRGHHKAIAYLDMPRTVAALQEKDLVSTRAAEFAILTAGRSSEIREAVWSEIDFETAVWSIPSARMKMERDHRVPLVPRAIDILKVQRGLATNELVFNGDVEGRPVSDNAVIKQLRAAADDLTITLHGVRSSFKDWASDMTSHEEEAVELALAHVAKGVKKAYRRGDALEKRRALMADWSQFCNSHTP